MQYQNIIHLEKTALIAYSKEYFPNDSGTTIYNLIDRYNFNLSDKKKYESEYEYGVKLFNDLKSK